MLAHHVCIQTNDYEASKRFYTQFLDFALVSEVENFHGRAYNSWLREPGGFLIELQTPKKDGRFSAYGKDTEGLAHLCFVVEDVEKEAARLINAGFEDFKRKNGSAVYEVLGSKLCKVIAPEGTIIELRDTAEL